MAQTEKEGMKTNESQKKHPGPDMKSPFLQQNKKKIFDKGTRLTRRVRMKNGEFHAAQRAPMRPASQ